MYRAPKTVKGLKTGINKSLKSLGLATYDGDINWSSYSSALGVYNKLRHKVLALHFMEKQALFNVKAPAQSQMKLEVTAKDYANVEKRRALERITKTIQKVNKTGVRIKEHEREVLKKQLGRLSKRAPKGASIELMTRTIANEARRREGRSSLRDEAYFKSTLRKLAEIGDWDSFKMLQKQGPEYLRNATVFGGWDIHEIYYDSHTGEKDLPDGLDEFDLSQIGFDQNNPQLFDVGKRKTQGYSYADRLKESHKFYVKNKRRN